MKAVLKFDLSIPEDLDDFRAACKAVEMAAVLWQLKYNVLKRIRWELDRRAEAGEALTAHDGAEAVMDEILRLMDEEGVRVEEMVR